MHPFKAVFLMCLLNILGSTVAHSQTYVKPNTTYGIEYYRLKVDSALVIPRKVDTTLNSLARDTFPQIFVIDTFLFLYSNGYYCKIGSSASPTTLQQAYEAGNSMVSGDYNSYFYPGAVYFSNYSTFDFSYINSQEASFSGANGYADVSPSQLYVTDNLHNAAIKPTGVYLPQYYPSDFGAFSVRQEGQLLYNTGTHKPNYWNGQGWADMGGGKADISNISGGNSFAFTADVFKTANEELIYVDASEGSSTIYLPEASTWQGYTVSVIKTDASSNTVTVSGSINGGTEDVLTTQWQHGTYKSNGAIITKF